MVIVLIRHATCSRLDVQMPNTATMIPFTHVSQTDFQEPFLLPTHPTPLLSKAEAETKSSQCVKYSI